MNRIKGLCAQQGVYGYEPIRRDRHEQLARLVTGDGRPLPPRLRAEIGRDRSKILVLSTFDDSRGSALGCGEFLSSVLLECTIAGLATCTLTHMIEVTAAREIVRRLIGKSGMPQVLIRVGVAPETESPLPRTPRRPLTEVLEIRQ